MSSHLRTAALDTSSSMTIVDHNKKPLSALSFEEYVGDDNEDPLPPPPSYEANEDPNLVTWDGPDDLENPQNWSRKYKWIITIDLVPNKGITSVMTVNV
jgi:DHA1 family multidrug resistance protein-like MFS transporter